MNDSALTLYQLNCMVRDTLRRQFPTSVWVKGELAEGKRGNGGHFYGELIQKEGDRTVARARVTCWASKYQVVGANFLRQTGKELCAGLTVMLKVSVTFHEQYGYSLNIDDIDPTYTLGDLERRRQEILAQLKADGLLDANKQLELPTLVQRIAVVSSATAAGYGDFCNQLMNNEFGLRFETKLFPTVMQGTNVPESVAAALMQIAAESDKWDVAVIIRGGGAAMDLVDFDNYSLAACVAQMPLPVITGIGHERDTTVLDYVAHTRQKTPTAVAAFIIQCMADQLSLVLDLQQRIVQSARERLRLERERLKNVAVRLPLACRAIIQNNRNALDRATMRLGQALSTRLQQQQHALEMLETRLVQGLTNRLQQQRHALELLQTRLKGLDPKRLLAMGYSITTVGGRAVRSADDLHVGDEITTTLHNGEIKSTITCKRT